MAEAIKTKVNSRSKPASLCSFRLEKEFNREFTLGIDEVGRGPLAGPVVVAGVIFSKSIWDWQNSKADDAEFLECMPKIDDSKRLKEETRERLAEFIKSQAVAYEIVEVDAAMIDQINILQATFRGAREVVSRIETKLNRRVDQIFFDGPHKIPMLDHPQHCIIEGDHISKSIAAASILAKVHRDQLMKKWGIDYPEYGFASHKGYGTRQHLEAIDQHGMTPLHRRSFLKKFVAQELGASSEELVAERIRKEGFTILERNWKIPMAEIDLIAEKDGVINFFEVRSRSQPMDLQAVFSSAKQKQVERAIRFYFVSHPQFASRRFRLHLATVISGQLDFIWDVFKF